MVPWVGRVREGRFDFDGAVTVAANWVTTPSTGLVLRCLDGGPARSRVSRTVPVPAQMRVGLSVEPHASASSRRRTVYGWSFRARRCSGDAGGNRWHPWFRKPTHAAFKPRSFTRATLMASPPCRWPRHHPDHGTTASSTTIRSAWISGAAAASEFGLRSLGLYEPHQRHRFEPQSGHRCLQSSALHAATGPRCGSTS